MRYDKAISELLGILQAIHYDEVINELEISSLEKWIDLNVNNFDPLFQEIISKLKKVLADNVITESEKNNIIRIGKQYYELGKKLNNASELIGIVEGIIADNEVNLDEVNKLSEWLNNNIHLSGTLLYDKMRLIIKNVMQDGILDNEEKQEIKALSTFLLKNNSLIYQVNDLKEKVKKGEIIGNQLIDLINDDTIISKIHNESIRQLNILLEGDGSVYYVDSEIIYLSLTLIALLKYDGNYYDHVKEIYYELYEKYTNQKIEGKIRDVINKYKIKGDDEFRIISSVLRNAIVPMPFLPSFFDFIFDIYRLNFNYNINFELDLDREFHFVYDGIKKDLNFESDSLNLKVTNKTYNLIKTTKDLILDDDKINSLITLSVTVLKIIDRDYWKNSDLVFENRYFEYGFDIWKKKANNTIERNKVKSSSFKSRWEPEFKLKGNQIYLTIPNTKIPGFYDHEKLKIEITNGDQLIYENDLLDVYEIIGGYRIENDDVQISRPLGSLKYQLKCGEEIIYDSSNQLFRKHILFNPSGDELSNNRDYEGVVIICNDKIVNSVQLMYKCDNYILGFINVKVGDYFKINDEIFSFTSIQKPGIVGKDELGKYFKENERTPIYKEVEGIVYESENSLDQIVVVINNKRYRLYEFEITVKKHGTYNNIFIKLELENGYYNIAFEEIKNSTYYVVKRLKFLLDSNFKCEIEQINLDSFLVSIYCLNKRFHKNVNYDVDDISLIEFNDIKFIIPICIPLFKIDHDNWKSISDNYIWIKDLKANSNLKLNGFLFTKVYVKDKSGNVLTTLYPTPENYYLNLSVGTLKSYEFHEYVILDFFNENKKVGILYCYCRCTLNNSQTVFWYDQKTEQFKGIVSYFGKGNIIVKVLDRFENVLYDNNVDCGKEVSFGNLKSFENYRLQIIDKPEGFTLEKEKVLVEKNIKFYSMKDFVGRYFQIYLVNFDILLENKFIRKSRLLYNTYVEIIERVDKHNFLGNLYVYKGKKLYLDKVNPVEIEFTSDISDGQIEASITKDGDGLFNDFEHHTILNTTESRTAVDIFSYLLNMERKR